MEIMRKKNKREKEMSQPKMQRKARRHVCLWFRLKLAKQVAFMALAVYGMTVNILKASAPWISGPVLAAIVILLAFYVVAIAIFLYGLIRICNIWMHNRPARNVLEKVEMAYIACTCQDSESMDVPYRNGYASTICMLREMGKEFRPYLTKAVILRYDVCRILGQSLESWRLSEVKQYGGLTEEQEAHYLAGQDEAMRLARQILA